MLTQLKFILIVFFISPQPHKFQNLRQSQFQLYDTKKYIHSNNTRLVKTFYGDKMTCLFECNRIARCDLVIWWPSRLCYLANIKVVNQLLQAMTSVLYAKKIPITNGLIHYWPLDNDLNDYAGSADLIPYGSVSFETDWENYANSSLYLNLTYCELPTNVYFTQSFTLLAWVKIISIQSWSRLIDCSTTSLDSEVSLTLSINESSIPSFYRTSSQNFHIDGMTPLVLNQWVHLAAVMDDDKAFFYINGVLQGSASGWPSVLPVNRSFCFIGRSNMYPNDQDADAYFDEIRIYNRTLSETEINDVMNF